MISSWRGFQRTGRAMSGRLSTSKLADGGVIGIKDLVEWKGD